jgi:hypothetical protein
MVRCDDFAQGVEYRAAMAPTDSSYSPSLIA